MGLQPVLELLPLKVQQTTTCTGMILHGCTACSEDAMQHQFWTWQNWQTQQRCTPCVESSCWKGNLELLGMRQ